jgi:hypothetical protein
MVQSEEDKYTSNFASNHFRPYVSAIRLYFIGAGSVVLALLCRDSREIAAERRSVDFCCTKLY